MLNDYSIWRIIPSKSGNVDFCGTVYAEDLSSAEATARLMYPVSGGDYLEVEEESRMKKHITGDQYFCKCERCGHQWISRKGIPQVCPNKHCHSPVWDKLKK